MNGTGEMADLGVPVQPNWWELDNAKKKTRKREMMTGTRVKTKTRLIMNKNELTGLTYHQTKRVILRMN